MLGFVYDMHLIHFQSTREFQNVNVKTNSKLSHHTEKYPTLQPTFFCCFFGHGPHLISSLGLQGDGITISSRRIGITAHVVARPPEEKSRSPAQNPHVGKFLCLHHS